MVVGSRRKYIDDPTACKRAIVSCLNTFPLDTVVMQGGERTGVDCWTKIACEITGHECVEYAPDRRRPSPQRFHERNDRMLDDADVVLAFWYGTSPGTQSVIQKAKARGLQLWVVRFPRGVPS